MIGGALMVRMPTTATVANAPSPSSSRAASSAPNLVPSRAGCRVSITGARRASGFAVSSPMRRRQTRAKASPPAASAAASALLDLDLSATLSTHSSAASAAFGDLAEGLEEPVQALYLVFLLGFLVVGAYLVVRQVLIRRELEEAAKVLGERIRTKTASPEDSFELGVILLRKKLYTSALKNLERARAGWDGAPADLAQVHNAIGYANFQLSKLDAAVASYEAAVELQPGYVTAWNNLGDAREKRGEWAEAAKAYAATLALDPANAVARARAEAVRARAGASSSSSSGSSSSS